MMQSNQITVDDWLAGLRNYLGVRFRHQGRGQRGLDCIGLLIRAAKDLEIAHGADIITGYSHIPEGQHFDRWCGSFTNTLPYNRLQPIRNQVQIGDIISFWIDAEGIPRHVAVYTGVDEQGRDTMIHSYAKEDRGVMEMPIDPSYWTRRVSSIYRLYELS